MFFRRYIFLYMYLIFLLFDIGVLSFSLYDKCLPFSYSFFFPSLVSLFHSLSLLFLKPSLFLSFFLSFFLFVCSKVLITFSFPFFPLLFLFLRFPFPSFSLLSFRIILKFLYLSFPCVSLSFF